MYTLTKAFRFESAHRLAKGYKGKCANIHGHSWNGHITVEVRELDDQGMSVDYARLKKFTNKVEERFDHAIFLCSEDDELIALCTSNGWKTFISEENPTSEVIAKDIYNWMHDHFSVKITIKSVTIEETCTTSCTYTG